MEAQNLKKNCATSKVSFVYHPKTKITANTEHDEDNQIVDPLQKNYCMN